MYPLGCDPETSLRELFVFFKRCLRHAEWELATACVPQLLNSPAGGGHSEDVKDIIKSIISRPYALRWRSVGTPHKLAWFWLQVLEKYTQERVSTATRRELEFLLLLEELGEEGLQETVLKELHGAFLETQTKPEGPMGVSATTAASVESSLRTLLDRRKPALAQALAQFLQSPSAGSGDSTLQGPFIHHMLERLRSPERSPEWVDEVCVVLSAMPWWSPEGGHAPQGQFRALCEELWGLRGSPLTEERLLSALLRPGCDTPVRVYSATALRLQRDHLLRNQPGLPVDLPEAEKLVLSLCCHDDHPLVWKTIYFECLSTGKHFLEQVLVTGLDLIKREEFSWLEVLLKQEFQPLSRLLLLLGWTHCHSLGSAQTLLRTLHLQQPPANDSVLQEFANFLSAQLAVLEWCQLNHPEVSVEALVSQLHTLDNHSALYVLHTLTPLGRLREAGVLALLQQLPRQAGRDDSEVIRTADAAVQRNVVLFQGFCAMKYALYALCLSAHKYSRCTQCTGAGPPAADAADAAPDQGPVFQHCLSECQLYLEVVPAMFRLELLENIFSLLFLSSSDFLPPGQRDPASSSAAPSPGTEPPAGLAAAEAHSSYLDLGHLTRGCRGFLVDTGAMEGFLRLLKEGLEGVCVVGQEAEAAESLGCSVTAQTFGARLQRLTKRTAEARWRLQIVTSNRAGSEKLFQSAEASRPAASALSQSTGSSLKKRRRLGRQTSTERTNGEASAHASTPGPQSWLVPAMLAPPESLLISCVQRGNFMEAHQVSQVFGLEGSECYGELAFMERYQEVLQELARVEQKMESQSLSPSSSSSEGGVMSVGGALGGRSRLGSSGRSTLQAIGSAAAAGMAFYSISDIADRLLSTPAAPIPSLEEGYWLDRCPPDRPHFQQIRTLLEELSPPAMAAFDLACCHCHLWKTSRQLLDTAERRLHSSLEARGVRGDPKLPHPGDISGFPAVLQQISKILNHTAGHKGSTKTEAVGDDPGQASGPFGCCIQEVLLSCLPTLTQEGMAARLGLAQRLEQTVLTLNEATHNTEGLAGSSLLAALLEQAGLKQAELDSHPVRSGMKHLLRTLDQLCPFEPGGSAVTPDYMRTFLDYVNTMAAVLVRSLSSEDQAEVKLGNPLLLLLQSPSQLLSHLLFDRQVSPERVRSLLQQASLHLSVEQHLHDHMTTLGVAAPPPKPSSFDCSEASARSPLLATLACLSAARRVEVSRTQPSGWSGYFRAGGRKDLALEPEQVAREGDTLLRDFPVLRAYLHTMAEPVLGPDAPLAAEEGGLGAALCGKPLVSLLLGGPQGDGAQAVALEAFQQALVSRDLGRALSLLELYGSGGDQEGALRDRLLACSALEDGVEGIRHLFRVKDPGLRAQIALQALERWPLCACLELLEFCLNDPDTEAPLRADLEARKRELDIYRWMLDLQPALPWASWQDLRTQSRRDSEGMFSIMLKAQEFQLCREWLQLFPVSEPLRIELQTQHLLHLLDTGLTEEAHQLLEDVQDVAVGLAVCERALDQRPGFAACHFLANHLTLHFQSQMTPSRRRHIQALHLGSKVLLALPPGARQDYFPLLAEPLLILEQLLMNLKVEWAGAAVAILRGLLPGPDAGVGPQDVDTLLADYARKALDFPFAPRERTRSDSVLSLQDGSTPTHTSSASSTEHEKDRDKDRDKDRASVGRSRRSEAQFQPPQVPPARKDWVPDDHQDVCMVCQRERFTMFNRRHHCRRCGRLVCQACSDHKMAVEGSGEEGARVCDHCYAYFYCDSDDELEQAEAVGSPGGAEGEDSLLHLPEVVHRQVRLSSKPSENQLLRSEFYYEQAPSSYLCVAILSLHSDQSECGQQLIGHCRALSRGLDHAEVDAGLLTDVMKQLLFSAKLMFVKDGRSHDLPLCDSANYRPIPSLDDILETPAVARLRNQLLEAEFYQLAVEVSTKSGLDPSGVWQAWGMASLKAGHLSAARQRFSRVLKAPLDRNQLSMGPLLLQEIVQQLENILRPSLATPFSEDILASLRELEEVLSDPGLGERSDPPDPRLHQEALHYLTSYGTHLALVCFYVRHDCVKDALAHLLSKECPDEVFLDGVLQPCLERGGLATLQGLLESLDPGLELCSRYLIASCQLLQRKGHFHTLYQLQQFMVDHVRAAMTCIRFFTQGAHSYIQLGEQQRWLVRAKEHLRTFLQDKQSRKSDVSRHMNTIELQLEVTRFLHRCETSTSSKAARAPVSVATGSGTGAPPTLFGGSHMKGEVACKVMLGGKNIEEGFGIVYRIIQDFQLDGQAVYVRAAQRLVCQRRYSTVRQLLKCVGESGAATKQDGDAIVLGCVSIAEKVPADAKELEGLILDIKSTETKIKAYLLCGKLRPAYLQAVKLDSGRAGPLVQEVLRAAESASDSVMKNICCQWLSEHRDKSPQQRPSRAANAR
ncbi:hypothetical protein NHX12_019984 [Muraenolepis orangiensis]|uniref:Zinc finger FYVE domain-containing protein 26 n=1 Tax=Muraenolepis orangiensis TaxID=630683 RepID=A0A9Q0IXP4_9TELE|nr:hypothetical protein NHX12_019984 [Muraenolepis orangiensis]